MHAFDAESGEKLYVTILLNEKICSLYFRDPHDAGSRLRLENEKAFVKKCKRRHDEMAFISRAIPGPIEQVSFMRHVMHEARHECIFRNNNN
jgi:hypothetical protein